MQATNITIIIFKFLFDLGRDYLNGLANGRSELHVSGGNLRVIHNNVDLKISLRPGVPKYDSLLSEKTSGK